MTALSFRSLSFTVAGADLSPLLGTPVTPCLPFLPSLVLKGPFWPSCLCQERHHGGLRSQVGRLRSALIFRSSVVTGSRLASIVWREVSGTGAGSHFVHRGSFVLH